MFDHILEMERTKKLKIWDFSKGVSLRSMVFVKNLKFFHLFIFGKIRHENLFDDILEGKKAFLVSKIKKELVHGFGKKFEIFPCLYFWQGYQPAKCAGCYSRK